MRNFKSFRKLFVIGGIASVFFLQSCVIESGGSSGGSSGYTVDSAPDCSNPASNTVTIDYSLETGTEYSAYTFYADNSCKLVKINNANGKEIYAVYSNVDETNGKELVDGSDSGVVAKGSATLDINMKTTGTESFHAYPDFVRDFNADPAKYLEKAKSTSITGNAKVSALAPSYSVSEAGLTENSSTHSWYIDENSTTVASTLRAVRTLPSNSSYKVYVWVADNQWSTVVTDTMVELVADKFATDGYDSKPSIYTMVTQMLGKPWGTVSYSNVLASTTGDIHILYYDIPTQYVLGYFWGVHNITDISYSNGELMFFMDSAYLKSDEDEMLNTLAHEFQHMVHFYQKYISRDIETPTWLNEMMSMTIEDMTGSYIKGSGPENYLYPYYVQQDNKLTEFDNGSGDYEKVTSFGLFLVRHFGGSGLWTALMDSDETDGLLMVSDAIASENGSTISSFYDGTPNTWWKYAFVNWGVSTVMNPNAAYDNIPAEYGYPDATESGYYSGPYDLVLDAYDIFDHTVYPAVVPTIYSTPPSDIAPMAHVPVELTSSAGSSEQYTVNLPSDGIVTFVVAP